MTTEIYSFQQSITPLKKQIRKTPNKIFGVVTTVNKLSILNPMETPSTLYFKRNSPITVKIIGTKIKYKICLIQTPKLQNSLE